MCNSWASGHWKEAWTCSLEAKAWGYHLSLANAMLSLRTLNLGERHQHPSNGAHYPAVGHLVMAKRPGYYYKETILTTWLWLWFLPSSLSLFLLVFWICFSRLVNYLRYPMTFQYTPFSLSVSLSQFFLLTIQISECYLNKKFRRTTII